MHWDTQRAQPVCERYWLGAVQPKSSMTIALVGAFVGALVGALVGVCASAGGGLREGAGGGGRVAEEGGERLTMGGGGPPSGGVLLAAGGGFPRLIDGDPAGIAVGAAAGMAVGAAVGVAVGAAAGATVGATVDWAGGGKPAAGAEVGALMGGVPAAALLLTATLSIVKLLCVAKSVCASLRRLSLKNAGCSAGSRQVRRCRIHLRDYWRAYQCWILIVLHTQR